MVPACMVVTLRTIIHPSDDTACEGERFCSLVLPWARPPVKRKLINIVGNLRNHIVFCGVRKGSSLNSFRPNRDEPRHPNEVPQCVHPSKPDWVRKATHGSSCKAMYLRSSKSRRQEFQTIEPFEHRPESSRQKSAKFESKITVGFLVNTLV